MRYPNYVAAILNYFVRKAMNQLNELNQMNEDIRVSSSSLGVLSRKFHRFDVTWRKKASQLLHCTPMRFLRPKPVYYIAGQSLGVERRAPKSFSAHINNYKAGLTIIKILNAILQIYNSRICRLFFNNTRLMIMRV